MLLHLISSSKRIGFKRIPNHFIIIMNQFSSKNASHSTVDSEEVRKFASAASEWWNDNNPLIKMNAVRVPLIRDGILSLNQQTVKDPYPLKGYKIVDVGCGGGILSEPLARLGATVTGIDPGPENIEVAINHASKDDEIKERLLYSCNTVEDLAVSNRESFDAVVCSEVVEHVADVRSFVQCCVELTKNGGSLFFTTINRTVLSYILAIVGAEYILRLLPVGTHAWNKFITPEELSELLEALNCRIVSSEGYVYNPLTKQFAWTGKMKTFYALHAQKLP